MTQLLPEKAADAIPGSYTRYAPAPLSGVLHWGIFDRTLGAWCTLKVGSALVPLEWKTEDEAEIWLFQCRSLWRMGLVDPPDGWNGL